MCWIEQPHRILMKLFEDDEMATAQVQQRRHWQFKQTANTCDPAGLTGLLRGMLQRSKCATALVCLQQCGEFLLIHREGVVTKKSKKACWSTGVLLLLELPGCHIDDVGGASPVQRGAPAVGRALRQKAGLQYGAAASGIRTAGGGKPAAAPQQRGR